jgi:hypothetical protein
VLVTVTDRVGHTFSLLQVIQYYPPRLKVTVNTTTNSGGAGTSAPVYGFPLLLRLDSTNFNFARIKNNGVGLSFLKMDGKTGLPHEVDQWDSAGKTATVLVQVDTINSAVLTQFYLVRDRRATINLSNPAAVFNTAGYQGVWHLKESGPGWSGQRIYKDATPFMRDGIDSTKATGKTGVIGYGQEFNGTYDFIWIGPNNIRPTTSFTISAWVNSRNITTMTNNTQFILADHSETGYGSYGYFLQIWSRDLVSYADRGNTNEGYVNSVLSANTWIQVAASWQASSGFAFYINGVRSMNGSFSSTASSILYTNSPGTSISQRYNSIDGYLDEVRIANTVHSASWIKLSYENQKPLSAAVQVEYRP